MDEIRSSKENIKTQGVAVQNKDIEISLKEYCRFPHPQGFAVLLNGKWGSGKTHFIKRILKDLPDPTKDASRNKPLYVTLYGVKDVGEIADQLFEQVHPLLGNKYARLAGAVLRSSLKATIKIDLDKAAELDGTLPNLELSSILNGAEGRVIVFDDFERAVMDPVTILGFINPLVEHDDCKVLILADESHFPPESDYWKRKEKTIGDTFEFRADANAALEAFFLQIDDITARDFLKSSKNVLLQIFSDSNFDNLRLLKQFSLDF